MSWDDARRQGSTRGPEGLPAEDREGKTQALDPAIREALARALATLLVEEERAETVPREIGRGRGGW